MNENEVNRIAAMGHALRPDWPLSSLRTLLGGDQLRTKARRDMAVALAWVACENDTKTPARVIESGPWWHAANVETPTEGGYRPPKRGEDCPRHPGQWADSCGGCAADHGIGYGDETPATPPPPRARPADTTTRDQALAECRQTVRRTKETDHA